MKIRIITFICILCCCSASLLAQTSQEEITSNLNKAGGVYFAYPLEFAPQTPTPKGYEPFYISHYGRHGSRYLISDNDYKGLVDLFEKAHNEGALTELGESVYKKLEIIWSEAEGHGGDLTPLGVRQHRGIAERMYKSFPEAFEGDPLISARSTIVPRCAMSMVAFGDRLKELKPTLQFSYEMSQKYMDYLNFHTDESNKFTSSHDGPWVEEYRKFEEIHTKPDRLINALFSDTDFVLKQVNPKEVMWGLYWIAVDMQNVETQESLYNFFIPQELFDLWQCINYRFYVGNANHASGKGIVMANAKPLLRNIIESADEIITKNKTGATLRFGHDGNVIPLVALMHIENFGVAESNPYSLYSEWSDFKVVPMAANVQIVFYKKKGHAVGKEDVLVKILHNEKEVHIPVQTEMFPYYDWSAVKNYYQGLLK